MTVAVIENHASSPRRSGRLHFLARRHEARKVA